ncbi:MAG: TldD/PmbA family protein [Acidimicrobiales bacterium]
MNAQSELREIAEEILSSAEPGEEVEIYLGRGRETNIRVYEGDVEQFSSAESAGGGVRVIRDGRQGLASCGSLDLDLLAEALVEARDNAHFAEPDPYAGLVQPDGIEPADLDLWNEELAAFDTASKIELAIELERLSLEADPRITTCESADYADAHVEGFVGSTAGVFAGSRKSSVDIVSSVLAADGGETQTGFGFCVGRDLSILDPEQAARDAAERAVRMLGATKPSSERLTVVFDPWVTASLVGIIGGTLSGDAVVRGRSPFAERMGEQVAASLITLTEDPTNPLATGAALYDSEGLATRRTELIRDGSLSAFLHNGWSARRSGTESTGSATRGGGTPGVGCRALLLDEGTQTQAELIAGIDHGVLVQSVAGLHSGVNPVSGDFSTGAEGLRISNGELGEPLREFTIASTLQRLLQDVVAVGNDTQWLPSSAAGVTLVVTGITMSGQ